MRLGKLAACVLDLANILPKRHQTDAGQRDKSDINEKGPLPWTFRAAMKEKCMKTIKFTKMQGCGNDYVYINGFYEHVNDPSALAKRVSDRHFGIGSDGLVIMEPSNRADVRMRMFNPDGTEAQMCGNATRCVARYVYERGLVREKVIRIETGAGIKVARLILDEGQVSGATIDMGEPILGMAAIPLKVAEGQDPNAMYVKKSLEIMGQTWNVTCVSMGNPHCVVFLGENDPELMDMDLEKIGPCFEHNELFPERINTEFVRVKSVTSVEMRVWERGTGETMACGTGACATAVACALNNLTGRTVDVRLRGGTLRINWNEHDNHVYMTGPAVPVFDGTLYL